MNRKERRAKNKKTLPEQKPELVKRLLANAAELFRSGKAAEAERAYQDAARLAPDNTDILFNLGILAQGRGHLTTAEKHLERLVRLNPGDIMGRAALALLKLDLHKNGEALEIADGLESETLTAEAHIKVGMVYREAGKLDRALDHYKKAQVLKPGDVRAYYSMRTMHRFSPGDPYIDNMLDLEKKIGSLPPLDRIHLKFTLGKALIDTGDTDAGFARYAEANRLQRSAYSYDISFFERYVDSIIRIFTPDLVQKFKGKGRITSDRPIFIVGMPRSGSTLTEQILSSHPDVVGLGEVGFFASCVPVHPNAEIQGFFRPREPSITKPLLDALTPRLLEDIGQQYLDLTEPYAASAARVADKMLFNHMWTGLIRLVLPGARIIDCTRDPVDMGLSIWGLSFTDKIPWAYDLGEIGRYYLAYRKLMNHWHSLFPGEIYEANYEKIVADQEGQTRKLLEFCGLSWNERCLEFYKADKQVKTASASQIRQPIYKDSVRKWEKHRKHLKPLIDILEKGGAL